MQDHATSLTIRKEIEIDAPPDLVWPYVATRDGCRQWFCTAAEDYHLVLEPREGGRFEEWLVAHGQPYHAIGKVLVYDPPRRLVLSYRVLGGAGDAWPIDTRVTITLTDVGGNTRVSLLHTGFERLPDAAWHAGSHDQGWTAAQEDLLALLVRQLLPALGRLAIVKSIEVHAPAERVWWFVGTQEGNGCATGRSPRPPTATPMNCLRSGPGAAMNCGVSMRAHRFGSSERSCDMSRPDCS